MGTDVRIKSKCTPTQVKNCCKSFLLHLFSHVGLCILVVGYAVIGGFIFQSLESAHFAYLETKRLIQLNETRCKYVADLWDITDRLNILYEQSWKEEVEEKLINFEIYVKDISMQEARNASKWTFTSALLYSVSIITTIGYGKTVPQTQEGKMFTIIYAVVGVPLMLLWVSNIGNVMAHAFKFAYFHAPCCGSKPSNRKSQAVQHQQRLSNKQKKDSPKMSLSPMGGIQETGSSSSGLPTQIEFCLNNEKYETVLLQQQRTRSPSLSSQQSYPRTPPISHRHKGSFKKKTELRDLDPTARQILFECAEYNLIENGESDERSRELLQQLNGEDEFVDEGDGISKRSSDVESVIEIIPTSTGKILVPHGSMIPPPPTFDSQDEMCGFSSNGRKRKVSTRESIGHYHGTPSRIPLLSSLDPHHHLLGSHPDMMTVDIERLDVGSTIQIEQDHNGPRDSSAGHETRVPVSLVLFIVVLYIVLGACVFKFLEEWDFWDSAYFCFITLSTIGLGDLTPGRSLDFSGSREHTVQLVFCCFYLVTGLAIIAMSFNLVQEQVTIKVTEFAKRIGIIEAEYN